MTAPRNPALLARFDGIAARLPLDVVLILARLAIAATFWRSGQTKVSGLSVDLVEGRFEWGWPRLSDSAVALFRDEYRLAVIPPEIAAPLAAAAEHVFPVLLLAGLATRLSAAALLAMTAVIQIFVYPDAWPLHATWAACLLALMKFGAGRVSLDRLIQT
jgi:putative oxidoreductase